MGHPFENIPAGKLGRFPRLLFPPSLTHTPFRPFTLQRQLTQYRSLIEHTESLTLLLQRYAQDESPIKADLMCGVYQIEAGQPFVLPSVKLVLTTLFCIFITPF